MCIRDSATAPTGNGPAKSQPRPSPSGSHQKKHSSTSNGSTTTGGSARSSPTWTKSRPKPARSSSPKQPKPPASSTGHTQPGRSPKYGYNAPEKCGTSDGSVATLHFTRPQPISRAGGSGGRRLDRGGCPKGPDGVVEVVGVSMKVWSTLRHINVRMPCSDLTLMLA